MSMDFGIDRGEQHEKSDEEEETMPEPLIWSRCSFSRSGAFLGLLEFIVADSGTHADGEWMSKSWKRQPLEPRVDSPESPRRMTGPRGGAVAEASKQEKEGIDERR